MVLNKEQILRLYNMFDFEDDEEIVCADLYDDGQMVIQYIDSNGVVGKYLPYFIDEEAKEKLNFILYGLKLERVEQ